MGGESEVLIAIFHFVQWLFTAPYAEIRPYVDRIIYYVLVVVVLRWLWRKVFKK
jgi:hypothetical protein